MKNNDIIDNYTPFEHNGSISIFALFRCVSMSLFDRIAVSLSLATIPWFHIYTHSFWWYIWNGSVEHVVSIHSFLTLVFYVSKTTLFCLYIVCTNLSGAASVRTFSFHLFVCRRRRLYNFFFLLSHIILRAIKKKRRITFTALSINPFYLRETVYTGW